MRRLLLAVMLQGLGATLAFAQGPAQPVPASTIAPIPMPNRVDPFAPAPTDLERRQEDERRMREALRPMIDQMRDGLMPLIRKQIEDAVKEQAPQGKPSAAVKAAPEKPKPERKLTEEEEADARYDAAYAKAQALAHSRDPIRAEEGKIAIEQLRRSRMARWSSNEGVYFIGCVNQKKYYRDKYGDVFTSDLWFNGSSGADNKTQTASATATRVSNASNSTKSVSSSSTYAVGPGARTDMAIDPCTD